MVDRSAQSNIEARIISIGKSPVSLPICNLLNGTWGRMLPSQRRPLFDCGRRQLKSNLEMISCSRVDIWQEERMMWRQRHVPLWSIVMQLNCCPTFRRLSVIIAFASIRRRMRDKDDERNKHEYLCISRNCPTTTMSELSFQSALFLATINAVYGGPVILELHPHDPRLIFQWLKIDGRPWYSPYQTDSSNPVSSTRQPSHLPTTNQFAYRLQTELPMFHCVRAQPPIRPSECSPFLRSSVGVIENGAAPLSADHYDQPL